MKRPLATGFILSFLFAVILIGIAIISENPDRTRDRQIAEAVEKVEYSVKINGRNKR